MPSTLKRRFLRRLLASLRPARGGTSPSFPVQTGFPTSLADLVVKNHGRLRKPRRPDALVPPPSTVSVTVEVADELTPPPSPPTHPLSPVAVRRLEAPRPEKGGAVFRLRPELLAHGGAVALALLAVWSEGTVAAFTVTALSLLWIESASRRRLRPSPVEAEALLDSCSRGPVSPIREMEEAACDSDKGSEAAERSELVAAAAAGDDSTSPKRKGKRSLRKLISKKLQKKSKSKDWPSCCSDGEANHQETAGGGTDPVLKSETPSESSTEWWWWSSSSEAEVVVVVVDERGAGVKLPLGALLAPVILAGLAVGKLPATVLAVLCMVFSSAVQRL